jgi:uncharacterized protein DUF4389
VRLVVSDDLRRSRVTVLFRLFLAVPHLIWVGIWGGVVYGATQWESGAEAGTFAAIAFGTAGLAWLVTLFGAFLWPELHWFHVRFLRWYTQFVAYLTLLADPWPRLDARDAYPIDLAIDPPERQNRWKTFFRIVLAIPAIVFSFVLVVVLFVVAFAGWFVCLILGRMPKGMRDLGAYCLRFQAQTSAYLIFLTDRYPAIGSGGPVAPATAPPRARDTSLASRLARLDDLRSAGHLTDAEYAEERRRLLSEFERGI